jgi:hypothetical protein
MGEMTAKNHYILEFEKVDLTLSELKISLAPGAPGHIRAMPIFLRNAANLKSGMWNNEVRITDRPSLPRGPHDYLAKSNITLDFSKGLSKYPRMAAEYNSLVLRGTVDIRTVPTPGTYAEKMLRTDVIEKLAGEQIYPSTLYFAGDGWAEYSESPMAVRQYRNIFAAFLYKRGNDCLYGVAEVVQTYDPGTNGYGNTSITFQKDLKTVCRGPN